MATNPLRDLPGMPDALERVEVALREAVASEDPFLTQVAAHLISAGGKRVRPALAIAVASKGQPVGDIADEVIQGAVAVELVHLGSLYHDDVMDEAATRRSVESVNARWGNLVAILAGDFLLARASELASALGTEVAGLLAATISRLCEGQVAELQRVYDVTRDEDSYLRSISGKTAALLATACRIGSIVGGRSREEIDAFTTFGDQFGMLFQIVDDVLDVVATDEQLGKPAGNDVVEGVYTLPVIRSLAAHDPDGELRALLGAPLDRPAADKVRSLVKANGAVAASLATAAEHSKAAVAALESVGGGPEIEALRALALRYVEAVPA